MGSSAMPAFADVLSMVASIPDECHQRRVTHWAKEKYKVEGELEEKVERLEKTLANRDFKVKNLEQDIHNPGKTRNRVRLEIELDSGNFDMNAKLLQNVQVAYNTIKKDFSTSEKKVRILEGQIEAMEKDILEKNQAIKAILSESDDLQKQLEDSEKKNVFYEKEITKLLDEKEQLLEAAKKEEESSDESSDDSDDDSSEDSDDDSESSDESEDSDDDDDDQTRFVAAATLLRRMESTIEKLEASEEKVKKLTEELESVKKEQQEMETAFTDRHTKLAELATDSQAKYEKCEQSKKEMHLQWSKKLDAERLLKEKALKDVSSATRTIDYMKKIMHAENTKFQSMIDEAEKKQLSITEELKVTRDQKLALERKFKKLDDDYKAKRATIAEKDLLLFIQRNTLKELRESERNQCDQRLASQDKLVAQMEKTFELQEEIKKLNDKIENLGVENIESEDEEEEEVKEEVKEEKEQKEEDKEQEVEEKKVVDEEEYNSDSSFEPIDEADLYD
ncbi:hypothetical protein GCK72_000522 [Caenorhabditis remanei]|uniref:Uncharacterized protein n=1 Tax=Caenorhabditis remanei TaxID=31234 RepID=A0A6A5HM96_CAERE|nr:hypothetical protein GCK72_000522 [Caenorhabditis remanei]KAF1768709.1 hypothetical protein GCK72_000522 [Caenorhabditis remanei]